MKKFWVHTIIFFFVVVIVFQTIINTCVLPLVKSKITQEFSRALGVRFKIREMAFQILPGWLEVKGVEIKNPPDYQAKNILSSSRIWINVGYLESLWRRMFVAQNLLFERPVFNWQLKKNKKNNLAELLANLSKGQKPKPPAKKKPALNFAVKNLFLYNGRIIILDEATATPAVKLVFRCLNFKILKLDSHMPEDKMATVLKGSVLLEPATKIKLEGLLNPFKEKIDFDARLIIEALKLENFLAYFRKAPIKINRGEVFSWIELKCRSGWLSGGAKIDVNKLNVSKTGGIIDGLVDFVQETRGVLHLTVPVAGSLLRPKIDVVGALGELLANRTEGEIKGFFQGVFGQKK